MPPAEDRNSHHQQDIADDRAGDGGLHHAGQPFRKRHQCDNQLCGVAESRIQQSADSVAQMFGEFLGRAAHPACERNDRKQEQMNKAVSFPSCGQIRSTMATGTKTRSQLSEGFNNDFILA